MDASPVRRAYPDSPSRRPNMDSSPSRRPNMDSSPARRSNMDSSPRRPGPSPSRPSLRRRAGSGSDASARSASSSSSTSTASHPSRELLFGEIASSPSLGCSSFTSASTPPPTLAPATCALIFSTSPAFTRLWSTPNCRTALLSALSHSPSTLASLRLVCHDLSTRCAPPLFTHLPLTFRPATFSKPRRQAALARIGHHVKTLTFTLPHGPSTFLPPLLDPESGTQIPFTYVPPAAADAPRYPPELASLLIAQYPPLFHAATNVGAFMTALSALPSLESLTVSTPGAAPGPAQAYRRSTVDYALLTLRLAIERAPLPRLSTLNLVDIHPQSLFYLRPTHGPGATPGSAKRWAQIRTLHLSLRSDLFTASASGTLDPAHVRPLSAFLRAFAPSLEDLAFEWLGPRAASPLEDVWGGERKRSPPAWMRERERVEWAPRRRPGTATGEGAALHGEQGHPPGAGEASAGWVRRRGAAAAGATQHTGRG
ncbi:hypothetical protein EJ06DRAFT_520874 [Trichodelitschia bisporula]|uniref:Uncharacterized protein n=1 Tax=Trichodelitschia bisporula TaxID=703511 RepID=A0A6G1I114_9PEZI|nr:hypothetical protein EJ06DRAFT_520874 [Trichodelitschia bisporula]